MKKIVRVLLSLILALGSMLLPNSTLLVYSTGIKPMVEGGAYHTVALKDDGTVWGWGNNTSGELGDGTYTLRTSPVQAIGLTYIISVACGEMHTVALKSDGTVWTWGSNNHGQRGSSGLNPAQVNGVSDVTAIACGDYYTLVLKSDGTVWGWGQTHNGELGIITTGDVTSPQQISGLTDVIAIACDSDHSTALKSDGTVWSWGGNGTGQLGDGTTTSSTSPIQVEDLTDITSISCGAAFSVALKSDGTVWSWGHNLNGQLGDGTKTARTRPVQVSGLSDITSISCGFNYTVALRNDGTVWSWGNNTYGALGDGTTTLSTSPVQATGLTNVVSISCGYYHTIAVKSDGTVWDWGSNGYKQLGDGNIEYSKVPIEVVGLNVGPTITIPSPANLVATPGDALVTLTWDELTEADGFNIKRSTVAGGPYETIASNINGTTYTDTTVTNDTTYYYVVTAVNSLGESDPSNEASATPTHTTVPSVNLTATAGDAKVNLAWNTIEGATGYTIRRAEVAGGPYATIETNATANTYTDTTVTNGITYYYVVVAITSSGQNYTSDEASATPQETQQPPQPTGNRAILVVTMTNGTIYEYDLSTTEANAFVKWYTDRANGTGKAVYAVNKSSNVAPFKSRKDYLNFDKIYLFEVKEYKSN